MESEFLILNRNPERAYVHPRDEDLVQFLPKMPKIVTSRDHSFRSLSQFAKEDPSQYRLFCHGLVVEGYAQAPEPVKDGQPTDGDGGPSASNDDDDGASSSKVTVHRKTTRPSREVLPQDVNWKSPWAAINPKDLRPSRLPDPVADAQHKLNSKVLPAQHPAMLSDPKGKKSSPKQVVPSATQPGGPPAVAQSPPPRSNAPRPNQLSRKPRPVHRPSPEARPPPSDARDPDAMHVDSAPADSNDPEQPRPPAPSEVDPSSAKDAVDDQVPQGAPSQEPSGPADPNLPPPQITMPLPEPMDLDPPPRTPPRPSSPPSHVVPSTFPDEQSQLPLLRPAPPLPTATAKLPPPTDIEIAEFEKLANSINVVVLNGLLSSIYKEVEADQAMRYVEGESPAHFHMRLSTFWSMVRDRNHNIIPQLVLPYMRCDHPDIWSTLVWEELVDSFNADAAAEMQISGAIDRFHNRHNPNQAPVYNIGDSLPTGAKPGSSGATNGKYGLRHFIRIILTIL